MNFQVDSTLLVNTMAAFSRGLVLRQLVPIQTSSYICARCAGLSTSGALASGHNRWSKIKHEKGAVDAKKNKQRSIFAHEIATASKCQSLDVTGI
jgi:hypothetical protein